MLQHEGILYICVKLSFLHNEKYRILLTSQRRQTPVTLWTHKGTGPICICLFYMQFVPTAILDLS